MKINTQKLLLFLAFSRDYDVVITTSILHGLVELSDGGFRSLIFVLKQKQMITHPLGRPESWELTPYGWLILQKRFPALTPRGDEDVQLLIFHQAPAYDPHFRLLMKEIVKAQAIHLQRGVYLLPGAMPLSLLNLCQERYFAHVLLVQVGQWLLPNQMLFLQDPQRYTDVHHVLSGVSSRLQNLISIKKSKKQLNHQQKIELNSLFIDFLRLFIDHQAFFQQTVVWQSLVSPLVKDVFSLLES